MQNKLPPELTARAQSWFEMPEIRRRFLKDAVWIPLRASDTLSECGEIGSEGHLNDFYGCGSLMVPKKRLTDAQELGWSEIGISHEHRGWVDRKRYVPADVYESSDGKVLGTHLVLEQRGSGEEHNEWHLHQDLVLALELRREGDVWVRPGEGYIEVAKLTRNSSGSPRRLEIRSSHLKDYLSARNSALYITSYWDRSQIVQNADHINWVGDPLTQENETDRWEGRVQTIHEGGHQFGGSMAVIHVTRTDVDGADDVPCIEGPPTDENTTGSSFNRPFSGRKLFRIWGELWRNEWIEPGEHSQIVRGDKVSATIHFITDASLKKETRETLTKDGRWLWFKPEAIPTLTNRRGGKLEWYTRDIGSVGPLSEYSVHFGVNSLGLINVYAKDIAYLPDWVQAIWAGFNVAPDGKVSPELFQAQAKGEPSSSQAPEAYLESGLLRLKELALRRFGTSIFREHVDVPVLMAKAHRFQATDGPGLFRLAKDIARITADCLDATILGKQLPPSDKKLGSLKALEGVLAADVGAEDAHRMMGPLFAVYDMRHADAHLPGSEFDEALSLLRIDKTAPFVIQGLQLLNSVVGAIFEIGDAWASSSSENASSVRE